MNLGDDRRLVLLAHVHAHSDGDVDFETLRDRLDLDERTWLGDSISRLYPNHPWLERLSDKDQDQIRTRTRTRTRTSPRPRSGYRDRRARPSDPAGGA
jgi:hypothetical protein